MKNLLLLSFTFFIFLSCANKAANSKKNGSETNIKSTSDDSDEKLTIEQMMQRLAQEKVEDMSSIVNQHLNVSYAKISKAQQLDIFIPEGAGPFPAVLLIHGGAFAFGDKTTEYFLAKKLVEHGFAAIPINYRLSGEAIFPAAVYDCKAAVRYIRANASQYNINPHKIGAWGASSGGYFSSILGTSSDSEFMNGSVGAHLDTGTEIQAVIDWYGPIDFSTMVPQAKSLGFPSDYDAQNESLFIGADIHDPENSDQVAKTNPLAYVNQNAPPFWIEVGSQDTLIPYLQSLDFAEQLTTVLGKEKVEFTVLEGAGHGGELFNSDENIAKAMHFLNKHLKD